jgi:hypothetical protein
VQSPTGNFKPNCSRDLKEAKALLDVLEREVK